MSPDKPTRDAATGERDPRKLYDREAGESKIEEGHEPQKTEGRRPHGSTSEDPRHAPHITRSDRRGGIAGPDAPTLPANAHGEDKVSMSEADQPIREESMYDDRRDQDKDRPPSSRR